MKLRTLLSIFLMMSVFACKQKKGHVEDAIETKHHQNDANKSNTLNLEVIEFNETQTEKLKNVVKMSLAEGEPPNIFLNEYPDIEESFKNLVFDTKTIFVDFNKDKQLYSLETNSILEEGCYPYLIDMEKKIFLVNLLLEDLDIPLNHLNLDLDIYSAGKICLDKHQLISSVSNGSRFSSSFHSNQNMLEILDRYHIALAPSGEGLQLTGSGVYRSILDFINGMKTSQKEWQPVDNLNTSRVKSGGNELASTLTTKTTVWKTESGALRSKKNGTRLYSGKFTSTTRSKTLLDVDLPLSANFNVGKGLVDKTLFTKERKGLFSKTIGKRTSIKSSVLKIMDREVRKVGKNTDGLLDTQFTRTVRDIDNGFEIHYIPRNDFATASKELNIDFGNSAVIYPKMGYTKNLEGQFQELAGPYIVITKKDNLKPKNLTVKDRGLLNHIGLKGKNVDDWELARKFQSQRESIGLMDAKGVETINRFAYESGNFFAASKRLLDKSIDAMEKIQGRTKRNLNFDDIKNIDQYATKNLRDIDGLFDSLGTAYATTKPFQMKTATISETVASKFRKNETLLKYVDNSRGIYKAHSAGKLSGLSGKQLEDHVVSSFLSTLPKNFPENTRKNVEEQFRSLFADKDFDLTKQLDDYFEADQFIKKNVNDFERELNNVIKNTDAVSDEELAILLYRNRNDQYMYGKIDEAMGKNGRRRERMNELLDQLVAIGKRSQ